MAVFAVLHFLGQNPNAESKEQHKKSQNGIFPKMNGERHRLKSQSAPRTKGQGIPESLPLDQR
jgi:hypothetical protein